MIYLFIALGVAVAALIAAFVWFSNKCIKVTRYSVSAPENLKIVHLSDLHGARFGKNNAKLFEKVAAEKPDIIAFTGDIIHVYNAHNRRVALHAVENLVKIAPVYYVAGNHEMRDKGYRQLRAEFARAGAVILDDKSLKVNGLIFSGLNCASLKNEKIKKIVPDEFGYKILLAHEPQFIKSYAEAGVDLALCGHAHGGQWRIPFTNIGIYAPGQGLFPKYCSGVYKNKNTTMIVSRGLGNSEFPLRLFNRPEIVVVELVTR